MNLGTSGLLYFLRSRSPIPYPQHPLWLTFLPRTVQPQTRALLLLLLPSLRTLRLTLQTSPTWPPPSSSRRPGLREWQRQGSVDEGSHRESPGRGGSSRRFRSAPRSEILVKYSTQLGKHKCHIHTPVPPPSHLSLFPHTCHSSHTHPSCHSFRTPPTPPHTFTPSPPPHTLSHTCHASPHVVEVRVLAVNVIPVVVPAPLALGSRTLGLSGRGVLSAGLTFKSERHCSAPYRQATFHTCLSTPSPSTACPPHQ